MTTSGLCQPAYKLKKKIQSLVGLIQNGMVHYFGGIAKEGNKWNEQN